MICSDAKGNEDAICGWVMSVGKVKEGVERTLVEWVYWANWEWV